MLRGLGARGSATVPRPGQSAADVLHARAEAWRNRPLTREIYRRYFQRIARELAPGGVTVELGGGSGMSREFLPGVYVSDIVGTPFVDFVADAQRLPLADGRVDNLIMVDLVHHLPHPQRLFREASRVLRPGGRMVMLEPYISPLSAVVFRLGHPEPFDLHVDPLPPDDQPVFDPRGPFASNQAIPTLLFGRHRRRFERMFPQLRVRAIHLDSVLVYPLSGGFSGPCLLPRAWEGAAWRLERCLLPLARGLAFRMLVVLERL